MRGSASNLSPHKCLGAIVIFIPARHHTRHLQQLRQKNERTAVQRVELLVHDTKRPRRDNRRADEPQEEYRDDNLAVWFAMVVSKQKVPKMSQAIVRNKKNDNRVTEASRMTQTLRLADGVASHTSWPQAGNFRLASSKRVRASALRAGGNVGTASLMRPRRSAHLWAC